MRNRRQLKWTTEDLSPVAPSPMPCLYVGRNPKAKPPRQLSLEETHDLGEKYSEGTLRVKRAGFDLVEFHGDHGYLINQFMSPHTNKRLVQYRGNLQYLAKILWQ
jgi:2,4-dienoyl-CoA reductase-like NADH-dependent reductase (Old Yellow Enzyme family)